MTRAQLFWDTSDPTVSGWVLRFLDEAGDEQTYCVNGEEDDSVETLSEAVADLGLDDSGAIDVFRGDRVAGRMVLDDGVPTSWRAK